MMGGLAYGGASGGDIFGKMIGMGYAMVAAGAVQAEVISCKMDDGHALDFMIDHNQFVDAVDADEPPRRKVTAVQYGDRQFPAEPIVMGGMRGFAAEDLGGTTLMFMMQPGGAARLTNSKSGLRVEGSCEGTQ